MGSRYVGILDGSISDLQKRLKNESMKFDRILKIKTWLKNYLRNQIKSLMRYQKTQSLS